ncbi:MAG: homoserine kinase [Myxococcota bacterium]
MALLTPLTLDEARAFATAYGVELVELTPIPEGSVNSNFRCEASDGTVLFIRVYEESDGAAVLQQNRLLHHLVENGVPTPAALVTLDGRTVQRHRGKPICFFPFLPGQSVCQQGVTADHCRTIGRALARIHDAGENYPDAPVDRFSLAALERRIAGLEAMSGLTDEQRRDVDRLRALYEELKHTPRLPETVVHGDVFRDNVLWREQTLVALLDFESASRGDAAFDLAVTLLAWCFGDDFGDELIKSMAAGYRETRALDRTWADHCFTQARVAALRFATTRLTDYELRPSDVVVYKDYRRFLARLAALEKIGPARFASWLAG